MADRNWRYALGGIAMFFLLLVMPGVARAVNIITVTTVADPTGAVGTCSLRQAITNANGKDQSGSTNCTGGTGTDKIAFSVSGTITLGSTLPTIVNTSPGGLTIDGSGQAITVDGASLYQIFNVNLGATLNLRFLTLAHGVVVANEEGVGEGGAVINNGGTLTVSNCTFLDNQATGSAVSGSGTGAAGRGGAIWDVGPLTVTDSTFSGNQATGGAGASTGVGGGIGEGGAIFNDGDMTVSNSTFSANRVSGGVGDGAAGGNGKGGAIGYEDGTATIVNSTFSANQAIGGSGGGDGDGGAIYSVPVLTITNATFSGNQATAGTGVAVGGAIDNNGTTVDLKSTILSSSTPGNCGGNAVTDVGHNISDDGSCGFTMAPSGTSINNSTTLNLDPAGLAMNGGPTETIALEPSSQAVDFIPVLDCTDQSLTPVQLKTDQRGFTRPDPGNPNFCDAGAFELTTMPFAIAPNSERLQIARSTNPPGSDQINTAFTFIENGFPTCDEGTDAFNGFFVVFVSGTCAVENGSIAFFLRSWVVHTVNKESYGTLFGSFPPAGTVSARMVELPKPAPPACGEWTLNLEIAGIDSMLLGDGPFSLVLFNGDGGQQCFDITNAIVGNQIPTPGHGVRRGVRRH